MLDLRDLRQKVDVVILSDHGMAQISSSTGIIDLDNVLDAGFYTFTGNSPVLNIWPIKGERTVGFPVLLK